MNSDTFHLQIFIRIILHFYKIITKLSTHVDNFVDNFFVYNFFKALHNQFRFENINQINTTLDIMSETEVYNGFDYEWSRNS